HVTVFPDLVQLRGLAEARHVSIFACVLLAVPSMIAARDLGYVVVSQLAVRAVDHSPELPYVEKKHLAASVAKAVVLLVACEKPEACGYLCRVEELARQRNHAIYEISLDKVLPDFPLA